jgi:CheY-like chemotaxis protein
MLSLDVHHRVAPPLVGPASLDPDRAEPLSAEMSLRSVVAAYEGEPEHGVRPRAAGHASCFSGRAEVRMPRFSSVSDDPLLVLVADDDEDMRAHVAATLRADGCSIIEARDGAELLEVLRHAINDPELRPDVLVTDVRMPRLSGLGVLDALRRAQWNLPVIMMTVVSDESIRTVAKRLGAIGVLHKPFDPNDLVIAVRNAQAAHHLHQ